MVFQILLAYVLQLIRVVDAIKHKLIKRLIDNASPVLDSDS